MRSIKLSGLFSGVSGEITDQVFVYETKHIIVLLAVHRDVFNQVDEVADGFGLRCGTVSQFGQSGLQSVKNAFKYFLVGGINQTVESGQCVTYILDAEITAFG